MRDMSGRAGFAFFRIEIISDLQRKEKNEKRRSLRCAPPCR